MDIRLYPQAANRVRSGDVVTTPTDSDYIEQIPASGTAPALITLANLFASPPDIGGTSAPKITFDGLFGSPSVYTSTATIDPNDSYVEINSATPATAITLTIAAPAKGRFLVITQQDSGTAGNVVQLSAGTFDGTNDKATFNAKDETLVLFGISTTRFVIVENIGSVALST